MILDQYEDPRRRQPPPEPTEERWDEPEDHCDYIDTLTETETETTP